MSAWSATTLVLTGLMFLYALPRKEVLHIPWSLHDQSQLGNFMLKQRGTHLYGLLTAYLT